MILPCTGCGFGGEIITCPWGAQQDNTSLASYQVPQVTFCPGGRELGVSDAFTVCTYCWQKTCYILLSGLSSLKNHMYRVVSLLYKNGKWIYINNITIS